MSHMQMHPIHPTRGHSIHSSSMDGYLRLGSMGAWDLIVIHVRSIHPF